MSLAQPGHAHLWEGEQVLEHAERVRAGERNAQKGRKRPEILHGRRWRALE